MITMLVQMILAIVIWDVFSLLENSTYLINASNMTAMLPLASPLPLLTAMMTTFALKILVTLKPVVKTKKSLAMMIMLALKNTAIPNVAAFTTILYATIAICVPLIPAVLILAALTKKLTVMITMLVPLTLAILNLDAVTLLYLVMITMNVHMIAAVPSMVAAMLS
jgi:hypothetical protein